MSSIKSRLQIFLILLVAVMVSGTLGFMVLEDLSFVDALYFNLVTIATVGYGDIHPMSQAGKVLSIGIIITGVGTFLGVVANATEIMLNRREMSVRRKKRNMVIGIFFSQIGTKLLTQFSRMDPQVENIRHELVVKGSWSKIDFQRITKNLENYDFRVSVLWKDLETLRDILKNESVFLLRLLENPSLLEHEAFTDLLQAVFHLTEELMNRECLKTLPKSDIAHISGDIRRVYGQLVRQWLEYMKHLKDNFPYLFSLSVRTNPFDPNASPIIE